MKSLPREFAILSRDQSNYVLLKKFILPFLIGQGFKWRFGGDDVTVLSPSQVGTAIVLQINYGGTEPKIMSLGGIRPEIQYTAEEFKSLYIDGDFDETIDNFLNMLGESEEDDWGWAEDAIKNKKVVITLELLKSIYGEDGVVSGKQIRVKPGPDWDRSYIRYEKGVRVGQAENSDYGVITSFEPSHIEFQDYWATVEWYKGNSVIHRNTYRIGPIHFDLSFED